MATIGSNSVSGITTTVFNSGDALNKQYVDQNVKRIPSQTGNAGTFLTTTDGINLSWNFLGNFQEFTSTGAQTFTVPSYANLLFIEAVGAGGGGSAGQSSALTGVTWTIRTFSINARITSFVFANNIWTAATVTANSGNSIHTSTNAIIWVARTSSQWPVFGDGYNSFVAFGNSTYALASYRTGSPPMPGVNTSTDAIVWTVRTVTNTGADLYTGNVVVNDLKFGNGLFIYAGLPIVNTSTNAIVWIIRTAGFGILNDSYGARIAVGTGQFVMGGTMTGSNEVTRINTSTDAINWVLRTSGFGNVSFGSIAFGNGLYVACDTTNILGTSTNAIAWTLRTAGNSVIGSLVGSLSFASDLYFFGTTENNGTLSVSTDAIVWTLRTTNFGALTVGPVISANNILLTGLSNRLPSTMGNVTTVATSIAVLPGRGGSSGSYTSWYVPKSVISSNITVTPGTGGAGATTNNGAGSAGSSTTLSWTGPNGTCTLTANGGGAGGVAGVAQLVSQSSSFYYTTAGLSGGSPTNAGGTNSGISQTNQFQPASGGTGALGPSSAGGDGGSVNAYGLTITGGSGGTSSGTNGSNGTSTTYLPYGSAAGGGGAGAATAANGGTGGRGAGGGGGAVNGSSFGHGGAGGNGYVRITWW